MISAEFKLNLIIYPRDNIERDGDAIVNSSLRVVYCIVGESAVLKPFPPFLAVQLDVEDRRKMRDPHLMTLELQKSLQLFAHMAMFSRVFGVRTTPLKGCIAKPKLMVGNDQQSWFDPKNAHHVLAALSLLITT